MTPTIPERRLFADLTATLVPVLAAAADGEASAAASHQGLLLIAVLGTAAFVVGHITRRFLSEVIVFLAIGIVVGPEVLDLVTTANLASLEVVTALALGAIVFGIGERLEIPVLAKLRTRLLPIAVLDTVLTFGLVFAGLLMVGLSVSLSYLLAAIALSTSPTTLVAVIAERRAKGAFTDHVMAATAVNNVTSAILFGLGLPVVLAAEAGEAGQGIIAFIQLVVVSALIGGVAAWTVRRFMAHVHRGPDRLLFMLVTLISVVAVSRFAGAPVVISTLVAGALTANDPRDTRPLFDSLRVLDAPIFLVFFIVAGAGVHVKELTGIGVTGAVLVATRLGGKMLAGFLGTNLSRSGKRSGWGWSFGLALQPFAGMAIGLAAFTIEVANNAGAAELGRDVSALVLGSVVLFELIGPVTVGRALDAVGDSGKQPDEESGAEAEAPHMIRHILMPISSLEMAHAKAPQVVDLAASTGAVLTSLHVVSPGQDLDPTRGSPAISYVRQVALSRNVQFEPVVRTADSVVDAIVEESLRGAVDVVVLGEPAPRRLDRGGGRRIVHEVLERLEPGIRVLVVPTVLGGRQTVVPAVAPAPVEVVAPALDV